MKPVHAGAALAGDLWLCSHAPLDWTLGPTVRGAHELWPSCHRNSGYRPSRVHVIAEGLSTSDPSLIPTHLSIRTGRATTTHYQVSLMVSSNTTLVPSLGLRIGPACEAGLSAGMRMERVPHKRKRKKRVEIPIRRGGKLCCSSVANLLQYLSAKNSKKYNAV